MGFVNPRSPAEDRARTPLEVRGDRETESKRKTGMIKFRLRVYLFT